MTGLESHDRSDVVSLVQGFFHEAQSEQTSLSPETEVQWLRLGSAGVPMSNEITLPPQKAFQSDSTKG